MHESREAARQRYIEHIRTLPKPELQARFGVYQAVDDNPYRAFEKVDHSYHLDKIGLGWAHLYLDVTRKLILWDKFYPHENFPELQRLGIGTVATFQSIAFMADNDPRIDRTFTISHSAHRLSDQRQAQLQALGIPYGMQAPQLPIVDYLTRVRDSAYSKGYQLALPARLETA